jgi:probable rRNA maturation factor
MKVLIKNQQRLIRINQQKLKGDSVKALELLGLQKAELSILLVNDRRMKALNSLYRKKDKTTDVLSFPQISKKWEVGSRKLNFSLLTSHFLLGDIVINLQAAKRQALEHGLLFQEELRWLLVHGILHLVGYDHERNKYSEKKMREKEKELLKYILKSS